MNINDVGELQELPEDLLGYIFQEQRSLMEKYHEIEAANGLLLTPDIPVNLHDKMGQARLKDFAWRTMEEIGEALEAATEGVEDFNEHAREEMADALHFLVELCILAGLDHKLLPFEDRHLIPIEGCLHPLALFVMHLGQTCNCLKNKPWKQTQMLTDTEKFYDCLDSAFRSFLSLCGTMGIVSVTELFQLYFRKSRVNQFRQRSNY